MMKKLLLSTVAATLLSADDAELSALKAQLEQMRQMMGAMQSKIEQLESAQARSAAPAPSTAPAQPEVAASDDSPSLLSQAVSMVHEEGSHLDLSLILDASYVSRSKPDEITQHLEVPGIAHGLIGSHSHGGHEEATYNASDGFNLNYAEMAVHTTVDPYLDADAVFHFSEDGVEIEEAYFTSRDLPYNLRFRGGKFLSDFGRLNNQHHHSWSFSDMPLVYQAFLGSHGIDEIGAQVQWIAPTSIYLMFGAEALQGKNEGMFGQAALTNPYDGEEILAGSANQPSLLVGYVKTSADIGDTTLLAGASIAKGKSRLDHFEDEDPHAFAGDSTLYGLDLTLKHYLDSYRSLTWQSEWLYRDMDGTQFNADDTTQTVTSVDMRKKQAGFYTQLVYAFDQNWKGGVRYDNIYQNDVVANALDQSMPENLDQYSAMIEYWTSEFARYRLQYTHSNALFDEDGQRQNLDSLIFSINLSLGAHAPHPF